MPINHINLDKKLIGKRSAGKPHAAFDAEGAGNTIKTCACSRPYLGGACRRNVAGLLDGEEIVSKKYREIKLV